MAAPFCPVDQEPKGTELLTTRHPSSLVRMVICELGLFLDLSVTIYKVGTRRVWIDNV